MVGVFRRSLSFPNKTPNRPSQKPPISHHIRSISLPCRSHPLISQIKDEINYLTAWTYTSKFHQRTSPNLCDGLTRLKDLHDCLHDILQLPQSQESLRSQPQWVEKLLEDFLRFVDVYGIFQTSILALKQEQSAAQMAIRKRDDSKVAMYVKAKKNMAKAMERLVSELRCCSQHGMALPVSSSTLVSIADAELAGVLGDIIRVTVSVSVALFNGIATSFASRKLSWTQLVKLSRKAERVNKGQEGIKELEQDGTETRWNLKKKEDVEVRSLLKRMRDLEECICGIESASERVFRAMINSRVALLNTLTQ